MQQKSVVLIALLLAAAGSASFSQQSLPLAVPAITGLPESARAAAQSIDP